VTDLLVRDVMHAVPLLEAGDSAENALAQSGDARLVAVSHAAHKLPAILRTDRIRAAPEDTTLADLLPEGDPPPLLEADLPLDAAVERLAMSFVLNPSLAGGLVEIGADHWGVVPRRVFVEHAGLMTTRGGGDRLEGAPVGLLVFECEEDHDRKVVAYYDPDNPPRCRNGHLMKLVD
jgi:hypothetical protein